MRSLGLLLAGCVTAACATVPDSTPADPAPPIALAEALIDAFYSFDSNRLRAAISFAPASMPRLLYYQAWAEAGHYRVLHRKPCLLDKAGEMSCAVTVKDDLIAALETGYDVTDTFHLTFDHGRIVQVRNSSDDPPQFDQALDWLRKERPHIFTGPCRGAFEGGPTPKDCVRVIVKGFAEFTARTK